MFSLLPWSQFLFCPLLWEIYIEGKNLFMDQLNWTGRGKNRTNFDSLVRGSLGPFSVLTNMFGTNFGR